jgi:very-short-patch-repair endonuclease
MASPHARALRKNLTDAESRLWGALRRRQLKGVRFRRQVPIGPFVADFACLSAKLIVELDGGQHAARVLDDARRDEWLAERGYRTLRIWNNDVFGNIEGVLATIAAALDGTPHPDPPPQGGRE